MYYFSGLEARNLKYVCIGLRTSTSRLYFPGSRAILFPCLIQLQQAYLPESVACFPSSKPGMQAKSLSHHLTLTLALPSSLVTNPVFTQGYIRLHQRLHQGNLSSRSLTEPYLCNPSALEDKTVTGALASLGGHDAHCPGAGGGRKMSRQPSELASCMSE